MSFEHIPISLLQKILSLSELDLIFAILLDQIHADIQVTSGAQLDTFDPKEDLSAFLLRLNSSARKAFAQRETVIHEDSEMLLIYVPMISTKKNVLGVVSLQFNNAIPISPNQKIYLETLVSLIAMAAERIQSFRDTKRILKDLQSSQERLGLALQAQKMGIWDLDVTSNKLHWDETMCEIYGVNPGVFPAGIEVWEATIVPEDQDATIQIVQSVLNNQFDYDHTFRIHKNGEIRYISACGTVIRDEMGKAVRFTGINWDVTEKVLAGKKLEQERAKSIANAKMASLGEMASGIAHEINNPLTIILNRTGQLKSSILKEDFEKETAYREIEKIESTFQRIVKIIKGLKAFSRNADNDPMISCDLNSIVDETLELCLEKFKTNGIRMKLSGLEHIYYLSCRPSQVSQVLLNLLNNSFDAIVKTNNPWIEIKVSLKNESRKTSVQIHVVDSGKGIPQSIAEKMMDPFFTTKDVGQGTGLGLPISKGIIEEYRGKIWLDKEAEHTSMVVELPLEEIMLKDQFYRKKNDSSQSHLSF